MGLLFLHFLKSTKALSDHDAELVHGIIGADILKRGKAVIGYETDYYLLSFFNYHIVKFSKSMLHA